MSYNFQKRAITKTLSAKSQSFGDSPASFHQNPPMPQSQAVESYYSYNYNIWSSNELDLSSISSGSCSPPSSLSLDFSSCQLTSPTNSTTSSSSSSSSQPPLMVEDRPLPLINSPYEPTEQSTDQQQQQTLTANGKRQLPSSKAQAEVISRCIEKNLKYRCLNKTLMCTFCKNNGESEVIYRSHSLKDSIGRITCPLLRNYVCPICGESGQNAHTITYCKKFKKSKQTSILNSNNNNMANCSNIQQ